MDFFPSAERGGVEPFGLACLLYRAGGQQPAGHVDIYNIHWAMACTLYNNIARNMLSKDVFEKSTVDNSYSRNIDEISTNQPKIHRKIHTSK